MLNAARKRGAAALLSIGVMLAGTVLAATASSQATAAPVPVAPDMYCDVPSANSVGFTPHLTLVTQPTVIQRTTMYRRCSASAFPNIRSGHEHRTINLNDDCNIMLGATGTVNYTITWNTGQTTTFSANRTSTLSGTTLTVSFVGTVTGGLFAGRRVRQVFTGDATELVACLNGQARVPFIISDVMLSIHP